MEKSTLYGIGIFVLLIVGGYFLYAGGGDAGIMGSVVSAGSGGEAQIVTLGMQGANYFPNTVTVKAGQPVRINADDTVFGCFRDFTIRDLGVRKYLATAADYVEFTPTAPGTYTFACSMGMGFGKLVVE
jgi:plastocyanin domain-containing protein